jgi:hypothetical protein
MASSPPRHHLYAISISRRHHQPLISSTIVVTAIVVTAIVTTAIVVSCWCHCHQSTSDTLVPAVVATIVVITTSPLPPLSM